MIMGIDGTSIYSIKETEKQWHLLDVCTFHPAAKLLSEILKGCSHFSNVDFSNCPQSLTEVLYQVFDRTIVDRVLNRYRLQGSNSLTETDAKAAIVGVMAGIRASDFNHLREANDYRIREALQKYRLMQQGKPLDLLLFSSQEIKGLPYEYELRSDLKTLLKLRKAEEFLWEEDQQLAYSEHLAHEVAYQPLDPGTIVRTYPTAGKISDKKVVCHIRKEGLVCFVLTPLNEAAHYDSFTLTLLFRGVKDRASLRTIFEPGCAGSESWKLVKKTVFDAIKKATPKEAKNINLELFGHSKGGPDAVRALLIANKAIKEANPSTCIRRVDLITWQGTGISHELNKRLQNHLLESTGFHPRMEEEGDIVLVHLPRPLDRPTEYNITLSKVHGDPIQRTGETSPAQGVLLPFVKRRIFLFRGGFRGWLPLLQSFGLSALRAHRAKVLGESKEIDHESWELIPLKNFPEAIQSQQVALAAIEEQATYHFFFW